MAFEGETVNKGLTQQEWGFILFVYRTETKKKVAVSDLSETVKPSSVSVVVNSSCNEQKTNAGKTLIITQMGFLFALFKPLYIAISYSIIKEMNYSSSSRQKEKLLDDLITHTLILFKCFFFLHLFNQF